MRSIISLLKANIKHKKGSFKSIAALMAIITVSFSCTVSNNDNTLREIESSFENYDIGDLMITLDEASFTDDIANALDSSDDVSRWRTDELIQANGSVKINSDKLDRIIVLQSAYSSLRIFNDASTGLQQDFVLHDGEAVIGYSLAKISGCEIGATIELETFDGAESFVVAGFAEDPIYGSSTISCEKIFITANDFTRLCSEKLDSPAAPYKYLERVYMTHIFGNGSLTEKELSTSVNDDCGIVDKKLRYITRSELIAAITLYSGIGTKLLAVFVALLTVVVIITIHNSISSSIEMDYVNLGILKSQGFTTWKIRAVFILQYSLALLIGAALGTVISIPLTMALGRLFIIITGILTYGQVSIIKCVLISLAIAAVCTGSVVVSTIRVGKISPVNALNGGSGDVYFSSRLNVPIKKKTLMLFIALRQITSKLWAYAGSCAITAILVFFMMTVTLMAGGLSIESLIGSFEDIRVQMLLSDGFSTDDMEELRADIAEQYDGAEVTYSNQYDVIADGIIYGITVTDNIGQQAKIYDGRIPAYANEIAITEIVADELGKSIGDTISVHTDYATEDYLVTGLYQTTSELGRTFIMDFNAAEKLAISAKAGTVAMRGCNDDDITAMLDMLKEKYSDRLIADRYEMSAGYASIISIMNTLLNVVIGSVFAVSSVFAFVVVTMLCKKALLREKRDIGIYKANGFSSGALRLQFSLRFLLTAAAGSLAGIAMSMLFSRQMLSMMLRIIGITDFVSGFTPAGIILPTASVCLCFFAFSYLASGNIRRIEVRELITE